MTAKEYSINGKKSVIKIGYNIFEDAIAEIKELYHNAALIFIISKSVYPYIEKYTSFDHSKNICIKIDDGENCKSFKSLESLCDKILEHNIDRNSVIIAIGGGTLSDLASLAASLVYRGLRLIQIPTTLIAQGDSAIGGKTAINNKNGKNLIGTFHLADRIYCDVKFLQYLHQRDYSSGYAEIVKYGLACDKSFYDYLIQNQSKFIERNVDYLLYIIEKAIDYKASIVQEDFLDQNRRKILNFGHTFGHAIEKASNYTLLHGEAVAIGMYLAMEFSMISGYKIEEDDLAKLKNHLNISGLSTELGRSSNIKSSDILKYMKKDKKNLDQDVLLIMLQEVGKAYLDSKIDYVKLQKFIESKC